MARKKSDKALEKREMMQNYQNAENALNNLPNDVKERRKHKILSQQEKLRVIKLLQNSLKEFMDSYILVGFNTDGIETVLIENNGTPMETRALNDLAMEFFSDYAAALDMNQSGMFGLDEDDD
jgi:glucosamine 6-phosphate synthetase-like amidotransferase/phosphosugar isomerase protein